MITAVRSRTIPSPRTSEFTVTSHILFAKTKYSTVVRKSLATVSLVLSGIALTTVRVPGTSVLSSVRSSTKTVRRSSTFGIPTFVSA